MITHHTGYYEKSASEISNVGVTNTTAVSNSTTPTLAAVAAPNSPIKSNETKQDRFDSANLEIKQEETEVVENTNENVAVDHRQMLKRKKLTNSKSDDEESEINTEHKPMNSFNYHQYQFNQMYLQPAGDATSFVFANSNNIALEQQQQPPTPVYSWMKDMRHSAAQQPTLHNYSQQHQLNQQIGLHLNTNSSNSSTSSSATTSPLRNSTSKSNNNFYHHHSNQAKHSSQDSQLNNNLMIPGSADSMLSSSSSQQPNQSVDSLLLLTTTSTTNKTSLLIFFYLKL